MAPIVYGTPASVPYRAVLMCGKALGLDLDIKPIDLLNGEHLKPEFLKAKPGFLFIRLYRKTPQHTIPLLEDDGFFLADSHAINGYLVSKYGKENDPLYPTKDLKRKATIDHRLHLDSSILSGSGILVTRPLILENIQPQPKDLKRLHDAFDLVEKLLQQNDSLYVVGNALSIADFSVVAAASSWKYFLNNFEKDFPRMQAYLDRIAKEGFYRENVEGLGQFNDLVAAKWKK